MAKNKNQKLKLLFLKNYLLDNTDSEHGVSIAEIIDYLRENNIDAERKSLYDDIEMLRVYFDMDIQKVNLSKRVEYRVFSRAFDLHELKLLGDAVQSSKFVTEKKCEELTGKLRRLCSRYEGERLIRQVYIPGRVRSMNESIYYNIDTVFEAISCERCITFRYFSYNFKKEKEFHRSGTYYEVSPLTLTFAEEKYYLVAYDFGAAKIKHFRVDRMQDIGISEREREAERYFADTDLAAYTDEHFSMFGGESKRVQLIFDGKLAGAVYDRFGRDTVCTDLGDGRYKVYVKVVVSELFFGWLCGLGGGAQIYGPEDVRREYVRFLESALENAQKVDRE